MSTGGIGTTSLQTLSAMEEGVMKEYSSSLEDLTVNSKSLISMLTMLADENRAFASVIVLAIEKHLQKVPSDIKLPVLYLIDSIVKNVRRPYLALLTQNIVSSFCNVFEKVDEKTKAQMLKLRHSWNKMFPTEKMFELDARINAIDARRPVSASPPTSTSIHLIPKFLQVGSSSGPGSQIVDTAASSSNITTPPSRLVEKGSMNEAALRENLLKKRKELLELQQKKLELELIQTKMKLEEKEKLFEKTTIHLKPETTINSLDVTFNMNSSNQQIRIAPVSTQLAKATVRSRDPRLLRRAAKSEDSNQMSVSTAINLHTATMPLHMTSSVTCSTVRLPVLSRATPPVSVVAPLQQLSVVPPSTTTTDHVYSASNTISTTIKKTLPISTANTTVLTAGIPTTTSSTTTSSVTSAVSTAVSCTSSGVNAINKHNNVLVDLSSSDLNKLSSSTLTKSKFSFSTQSSSSTVPLSSLNEVEQHKKVKQTSKILDKFYGQNERKEKKYYYRSKENINSNSSNNTISKNHGKRQESHSRNKEINIHKLPEEKDDVSLSLSPSSTTSNESGDKFKDMKAYSRQREPSISPPPATITTSLTTFALTDQASMLNIIHTTSITGDTNLRAPTSDDLKKSTVIGLELGKDVDLRALAASGTRIPSAFELLPQTPNRLSAEREIDVPPMKKSKVDNFDALFGREDTDMRQELALPLPLPPPPSPVISPLIDVVENNDKHSYPKYNKGKPDMYKSLHRHSSREESFEPYRRNWQLQVVDWLDHPCHHHHSPHDGSGGSGNEYSCSGIHRGDQSHYENESSRSNMNGHFKIPTHYNYIHSETERQYKSARMPISTYNREFKEVISIKEQNKLDEAIRKDEQESNHWKRSHNNSLSTATVAAYDNNTNMLNGDKSDYEYKGKKKENTIPSLNSNQINVEELFQKLVATGIVPGSSESSSSANKKSDASKKSTLPEESASAIKPTDFNKPETLKVRQPGLISILFSGIQCSFCGLRFLPEQTIKYSQHLDWHFRQNRREKDFRRKAQSRNWYYNVSDWLKFVQIEDSEERAQSWFESQAHQNVVAEYKDTNDIPSIPCENCLLDVKCEICTDKFEQFYNEKEEEWHLKRAVKVDDKIYHPICYEDYLSSLSAARTELEETKQEEAEESVICAPVNDEDDDAIILEEDPKPIIIEIIKDDNEEEAEAAAAVTNATKETANNELKDDKGDSSTLLVNDILKVVKNIKQEPMDNIKKVENIIDLEGLVIKKEKIEEEEEEDLLPELVVDTTHRTLRCTIDGNIELDDSSSMMMKKTDLSKIKINLSKPVVNQPPKELLSINIINELSPDEFPLKPSTASAVIPLNLVELLQPPPPGEEPCQLHLKPRLVGKKLTELPPVSKGTELSGLCSVM